MNELDKSGSGLLIMGKKTLDTVMVPVYTIDKASQRAYEVASYPMDTGVTKIYQSRAGGFVPPSAGGDTCFSQMHYGEGFFEGMRFYDSPYGVVLTRPWMNYARFMHSASVFNPKLAKIIKEHFEGSPDLKSIEIPSSMTPERYYSIAEACYRNGSNMGFRADLKYAGGLVEPFFVNMSMSVAGKGGKIHDLTMREMDTIIKVLAYTGRLVSTDHYPQSLEMMQAGYIRPWGWVSGEDGLKVPSIKLVKDGDKLVLKNKPMYFAAATLPWGLYLTESDYAKGLNVLVSPYERINNDNFPTTAKCAGAYVNSLMPINLGLMFGFGEILAFNREKKFVEGSAENAFVFMEERGKIVAYTPDVASGCLPGTTRDGVIKAIESLGMTVKYEALGLPELYEAKAILLTGTGAQMIHVRSITELKAAERIAKLARLSSEGAEVVDNRIDREDFAGKTRLINNGERHEVVTEVQAEFKRIMTEGEPVHDIHIPTFAELVGLEVRDFTTKRERELTYSGYFSEHVNGITNRDELTDKHRIMARMIKKAFQKAPDQGIPIGSLIRKAR